MPISTVWILKYVQQCYVEWFWTISSLGAPGCSSVPVYNVVKQQQLYLYEHGFSTNVVTQ